jgi:hypothetical protein
MTKTGVDSGNYAKNVSSETKRALSIQSSLNESAQNTGKHGQNTGKINHECVGMDSLGTSSLLVTYVFLYTNNNKENTTNTTTGIIKSLLLPIPVTIGNSPCCPCSPCLINDTSDEKRCLPVFLKNSRFGHRSRLSIKNRRMKKNHIHAIKCLHANPCREKMRMS